MKAALAFLTVALLFATAVAQGWGQPGNRPSEGRCDYFAIRNHGKTLFSIDSTTGVLDVPHDLNVGTIWTGQVILGDYLLSVYPTDSGETLGFRKRRMDDATGRWHVPNCILQFAIDGTYVIYNDEIRDVSEFTLYELRDFIRVARADEMLLEGITDPFNLQAKYNSAGEYCKEGVDCISAMDDMFEEVTLGGTTPAASDYLDTLWQLVQDTPQAGEPGYQGEVSSISYNVENTPPDMEDVRVVDVVNNNGVHPGEPGFRLADSEVQDVFVLQAEAIDEWEIVPGVPIAVWGWKGGQVLDFSFDTNGWLNGGHIVVGPFPASDDNDVVHYNATTGWAELQAQVPGPALKLGFLRNTRIYVTSALPADETFSPAWIGLEVPHDQSHLSVDSNSTTVFEFVGHTFGTHLYSTWGGFSWGGPVLIDYPGQSTEADREYVVFLSSLDDNSVLNGNSFPGTARRLSGWFRDTIAIESSYPGQDDDGNEGTIVVIRDDPRPSAIVGDNDPLRPVVAYDCPAYGGPLLGRVGTGCVDASGVHRNAGHQITSTTLNPGQMVEIVDHLDNLNATVLSINGAHYVKALDETSFFIPVTGTNGGVGGVVHIWRLHKSDPLVPTAQNNGVSGGYFRFNYGERIHFRFINAGGDVVPLHIHGHQWALWTEDGFALDFPYTQQEVTVAGGSSVDVLVEANNPNRYGAWLLASTNTNLDSFPNHPWPAVDVPSTPGGLMAYIDYTGFRQGPLAVDPDMYVVSFFTVPPVCVVEYEEFELFVDHRNQGYWDRQFLKLSGSATFVYGQEVQTVNYTWSIKNSPSPNVFAFDDPNNADVTYYGFDTPGVYTFTFRTDAVLSNSNREEGIWCEKDVVVNVPEGEHPAPEPVELLTPYSVNIAPADDTAFGGRSYPRGQATFTLHQAAARFGPTQNQFAVRFFDFDLSNLYDPEIPPTNFFRWSSPGNDWQNPDYWLDVPFDFERAANQWSFAIRRVTFDSRVTTYGFVLGSTLGEGVNDGEMPPEFAEVVYPLWQGVSNSGGSTNSRHDVYFLILEADDEEFCEWYGCVYTPSLTTTPTEALNQASLYRQPGAPSAKNPDLAKRSNTGTFAQDRATEFLFVGNDDPGLVPTINPATTAGATYSPLKIFRFIGANGVSRSVIANMPFVYWGTLPVQSTFPTPSDFFYERKMLLADSNGLYPGPDPNCNPYIRVYPSNPAGVTGYYQDGFLNDGDISGFWGTTQDPDPTVFAPWGGPRGCQSSSGPSLPTEEQNFAGERALGGQLLDIPNFRKMYVVFKLHRAGVVPGMDAALYTTITDTSDFNEAQFYGVIWSRALAALGRTEVDTQAVLNYKIVNNGKAQEPYVPAVPGTSAWSPFWHVTHLFWNCGTYSMFLENPDTFSTYFTSSAIFEPYVWAPVIQNMGEWRADNNRALPQNDGLSYPNPNTDLSAIMPTLDFFPLQAGIKNTWCPEYVKEQTGNADGVLMPGQEEELIAAGVLFETEHPAGSWPVGGDHAVVFNRHAPILFTWSAPRNPNTYYSWYPNYQNYATNYGSSADNSPNFIYSPGTWSLANRQYNTDFTPSIGYDEFDLALYWTYDSPHTTFWDYESFWAQYPPNVNGSNPGEPGWTNDGNGCVDCTIPLFEVDLDALYAWTPNQDVLYTVVECNDAEFANITGAAYTPALSLFDWRATTWASWWEEPTPGLDGVYDPADVSRALDSFVFYESGTLGNDPNAATLSVWYTPYKALTFEGRHVVCNMPFYRWSLNNVTGSLPMSLDDCTADGDCNPAIQNVPGQVMEVHLTRRVTNQATLLPLDITMKLHRAVTYRDFEYPYFAFFDASNPAIATYYGVAYSQRILWAGRAQLTNGVTQLFAVGNGVVCPGCFELPGTVGVQEPILPPAGAGSLPTPLHQLTPLSWANCTTPATCAATYNATVQAGLLPEPAEDQWILFFSDVEVLIDAGVVTAVEFPDEVLDGAAPTNIILLNTPVVATLHYDPNEPPVPPTPEPTPEDVWAARKAAGQTYVFLGTQSARHWSVLPAVPNTEFNIEEVSLVGSSLFNGEVTVELGSVTAGQLTVVPGDRVVFYILPSDVTTPHGLVGGMMGAGRDAAEDWAAFFEMNKNDVEEWLDYTSEERFVAVFENPPFGYPYASFGPLTLFDGYVRPVRAGTTFFVTDYAFGPELLSVAFVVNDYE